MKRELKVESRKARSSGKRRTKTVLGISIGLMVLVGIGSFIIVNHSSHRSRFTHQSSRITNHASPSPASTADQERAVRSEQLQAAQTLAAKFPDSDDAVYLLGLVYNDQGDSASAIAQWQRSLELDATRADAHESLGYASLLKDDYEDAEKHLRQALELDPKLVSPRFRLATTLVQQGKMREAITIFEGAPTSSYSAEMYRLGGEAHHQLKEYEKARVSYEAALYLNPDLAEAHYALSRICAQLGENQKATNHFEKFSDLKTRTDSQAREMRSSYDTLAITHQSVARTHTDVGRVYMIQRHHREAEELWRRAAALDGSNILCRLQLGVLYQQANRNAEALRFYEEAARLDPADPLVHLNIGRVSLKMNESARAERAFNEVVRLAPDRPEGHEGLAQVNAMKNALRQ